MAAVVLTVNVAVCAPLPIETEPGMLHVAGSFAPDGLLLSVQLRLTAPVNPFAGVRVIVAVLPLVDPGVEIVIGLLLVIVNVGDGAGFTITLTVVVCVIAPEAPAIVMV